MKSLMNLSACLLLTSLCSAQLADSPGYLDHFGSVLATGDFNNDGYDDQVVGIPRETLIESQQFPDRPGAVQVIMGGPGGLTSSANMLWHQDSPGGFFGSSGIPGINEDGDEFGYSLATGDFNGDGCDDLAIGAPGEDIGSIVDAGCVTILYGLPPSPHVGYGFAGGLTTYRSRSFHQNSPGILGVCEAGDRFGKVLTSGDFNNDGKDDLAISAPLEDVGSVSDAGCVHILYGTGDGLTWLGNQIFHQNSPGVPSYCEPGDQFGYSLTSGDFNGDNRDDLAVGVPLEDWSIFHNAGIVHLFRGTSSSLKASSAKLFQHSGFYGSDAFMEHNDQFGRTLASGDLNDDGVDDLVIGVPCEDIGYKVNAGAIELYYFKPSSGFNLLDRGFFSQDSLMLSDSPEASDYFGSSLAVADLYGWGGSSIIIGVPNEDTYESDAGMVHVLTPMRFHEQNEWGWNFQYFSPNMFSPDVDLGQHMTTVHGWPDENNLFGFAVSLGDFNGDGNMELSVGVPNENITHHGTAQMSAGMVLVFQHYAGVFSNYQYWTQGGGTY